MGTRSNARSAVGHHPMVLPKSDTTTTPTIPSTRVAPRSDIEPRGIPFSISLQEDRSKPGQFQLVLNPNPEIDTARQYGSQQHEETTTAPSNADGQSCAGTPKLLPTLGYNVSQLYTSKAKTPPSPRSPGDEDHNWSEINTVPPDFLHNVVPDWTPAPDAHNHLRKHESNQNSNIVTRGSSARLHDIKARFKKSGKGFIVRLRKSSVVDPADVDVKDVHLLEEKLDHRRPDSTYAIELPGEPVTAELDSTPIERPVFEIGSCGQDGSAADRLIPTQLVDGLHTPTGPSTRPLSFGLEEQWLSDAETLTHERPNIDTTFDEHDDDTSIDPASTTQSSNGSRRSSISSITTTPTNLHAMPFAALASEHEIRRIQTAQNPNQVEIQDQSAATHQILLERPAKDVPAVWEEVHLASNIAKRDSFTPFLKTPNRAGIRKTNRRGGMRQTGGSSIHLRSMHLLEDGYETGETLSHGDSIRINNFGNGAARRPRGHGIGQRSKSFSGMKTGTDAEEHREDTSYGSSTAMSLPDYPTKRNLKLRTKDLQAQSEPILPQTTSAHETNHHRNFGSLSPNRPSNSAAAVSPSRRSPSVSFQEPETATNDEEADFAVGAIPLPSNYETRQPSSPNVGPLSTFIRLSFKSVLSQLSESMLWMRDQCTEELPVPPGHVRVRWTCQCGEDLYDDFIERRFGAARWLEVYLNRPQTRTPGSPASSNHSRSSSTMSSIFSNPNTAQSSTFSSQYSFPTNGSSSLHPHSPGALRQQSPFRVPLPSSAEPTWLLTCANEGRFTTKLVHLSMDRSRIRSDKDLALTLREHYEQLNRSWFRRLIRTRGLTSISFVQFEVHRNRFADIRKTPDMPPVSLTKSEYDFAPEDLLPPVGQNYLLHLFKHPEDYDGEEIFFRRAPKRRGRLDVGVGWGIHLVEGFLASRVWTMVICFFAFGSLIFAVVWMAVMKDVQGAFGVAAWMTTLAGLSVAWAQAFWD